MKNYTLLLLELLLVVTVSFDRIAADNDDAAGRGDEFVDKILKDIVEENGHEYDPYEVEDSIIGFHKKVLFVNVSGEAKLHQGYITGLKSLHRTDNCHLEENNGILKVRADLGAGVLNLNYAGTAKFMNWGPTITVHGTIAYVEVTMKMSVNATTGRNGVLDEFYIDDMRGMEVWVTGLGPINWALNVLISGITKIFKGYVRNIIENQIESHISRKITSYQFPVEGVDVDSTVSTAISDTTKVLEETTKAVEDTTKVVEDTTKVVEDTTKAVEDTTKAVEDTTKAVEDTTKAAEDTTEAVEDTTEAVENTTEPVEDTTEAVDDATEIVEDTAEAADDTT